jgi:hypothetical protein
VKIRHFQKTLLTLITFPQPQVMQAYLHADYGKLAQKII